jgi:hypothetical protein
MLVFQNQLLHSCCILFHPRCAGSISLIVIIVHVCLTIFRPSAPFADMLHSNSVVTMQLYKLIVNFSGGDTLYQWKLDHTVNCQAGPNPVSLQFHIHLPTELHVTNCCALCRMFLQLQVLPLSNVKYNHSPYLLIEHLWFTVAWKKFEN